MKRFIISLPLLFIVSFLFSQELHQGEYFILDQQINGSHIYEASQYIDNIPSFEYTPQQYEYLVERIDPYLIDPPGGGETGPDPEDEGVVGTIDADFNVTPTGASVYSMTLVFPPGRSGMIPDLAIVYNSLGSDGYLGEKWSLSGLSSITRTAKTPYYHSASEDIQFDINDHLMLDGQHLLPVEPGNNNEYRTEIDNISKIIRQGDYFMVYTKSGLIKEYGKTPNSRHYLQDLDEPLAWCLNKVSDRLGNYISYNYYNNPDNGEIYIESIEYSGYQDPENINTPISPGFSITFEYENRNKDMPAPKKFFTKGNVNEYGYFSRVYKRLSKIKCYYEGAEVKKYEIEYHPNENFVKTQNKILSITEYGKNGTKYNSTNFAWQERDYHFTPRYEILQSNYSSEHHVGDFNGDGFGDILSKKKNGTNVLLKIESPKDKFQPVDHTVYFLNNQFRSVSVGDYNGDGLSDIAILFYDQYLYGQYQYKLKILTSYINSSNQIDFITSTSQDYIVYPTENEYPQLNSYDFTGNGLTDLFVFHSSNPEHLFLGNKNTPLSEESVSTYDNNVNVPLVEWEIGDFDCDGKIEICLLTTHVTKLLGLDFNNNNFVTSATNVYIDQDNTNIGGDFNGDSKTDVLSISQSGVYTVYYSYGRGFKAIDVSQGFYFDENEAYTLDINGDGLSDFIWNDKDNNRIFPFITRNSGEEFLQLDTEPYTGNTLCIGLWDIEGDGIQDLLFNPTCK